MADIKSPEARSLNMSRIRSKDTKPEVWLRKELFKQGYRYRKNVNNIPGHPDIWLAKYNTAIFLHGCFWHRHSGCKYAYKPKSNIEFWERKFTNNEKRDVEIKRILESRGVKNLIIWECTIKKMTKDITYKNEMLQNINDFILNSELYIEL